MINTVAGMSSGWRSSMRSSSAWLMVPRASSAAVGSSDILAEAAGMQAGSWFAWPSTHVGHELIAAGMLIMAAGHDGKPLDYKELERWTRVGYERGMKWRQGER
jgi:hypothetical protein